MASVHPCLSVTLSCVYVDPLITLFDGLCAAPPHPGSDWADGYMNTRKQSLEESRTPQRGSESLLAWSEGEA